jgi:hypothetical protein
VSCTKLVVGSVVVLGVEVLLGAVVDFGVDAALKISSSKG